MNSPWKRLLLRLLDLPESLADQRGPLCFKWRDFSVQAFEHLGKNLVLDVRFLPLPENSSEQMDFLEEVLALNFARMGADTGSLLSVFEGFLHLGLSAPLPGSESETQSLLSRFADALDFWESHLNVKVA